MSGATATALPMPAVDGPVHCVWDAQATLGEGLCWSARTQALWWVDILQRCLYRYRPSDGSRRRWQFDEEISAVAERADAPGLIVTLRWGFAAFDAESPDARPVYLNRPGAEPVGNRFNDGKCDRNGRFWAGTMDFACKAPTGALYRYDRDGRCVRHEIGFAVTNGPTWSLDERTMFFNDTVNGQVHAFDFDPSSGEICNQRPWLKFARGEGVPDGMTTDAAGRIWIAHWGGSCVSCHDPASGVELGRIGVPASQVTNCAFGGPDLRTMFITCAREGLSAERLLREPLAGALFEVAMGEPGMAASPFGG